MGNASEQARERRAILWGGALLAAVAVVGHFLLSGADVLWFVLLLFALAAIPQAFVRRSAEDAPPRRRR
jgi:hypothetical protein